MSEIPGSRPASETQEVGAAQQGRTGGRRRPLDAQDARAGFDHAPGMVNFAQRIVNAPQYDAAVCKRVLFFHQDLLNSAIFDKDYLTEFLTSAAFLDRNAPPSVPGSGAEEQPESDLVQRSSGLLRIEALLEDLLMEVKLLRADLHGVLNSAQNTQPPEEAVAVEVRQIDDEDAKKEVKSYFERHDGQEIYPDQVAAELNLGLLQVVRVCEELVAEDRLARK